MYCTGHRYGSDYTLDDAKAACGKNSECGCIANTDCNGISYSTHQGYAIREFDACVWLKKSGKSKFPLHTMKLIYFTITNPRLRWPIVSLSLFSVWRKNSKRKNSKITDIKEMKKYYFEDIPKSTSSVHCFDNPDLIENKFLFWMFEMVR